jgi:D-alanyl-D-alanine carboxypeptidase/D-alanyl-D-alanine-endopeptidase (penicillin-binding protein 4)
MDFMHRTIPLLRLALLASLAGCASLAPAATTIGATPPTDSRAALRTLVDSLTGAPEFRSMHWGILIVDPGRGETLYSRNADKLFMPASNQKLLTGSTALTQLGPDYRWPTTLWARGPVRDGVLQGDLVVRGQGDPTISAHAHAGDALAPLRALGDSLRARGVTRIRGRIVAAPSPFTDSPLGYGWSYDDLDESYSAGVDALYFNEGFTEIVVYGGAAVDDPVRVVTRPASTYPAVIVRARTVAKLMAGKTEADSATPQTMISVGQDSSRLGVLVSGTITNGDSVVRELAFRDQSGAFVAAMREALRAQGIVIDEAPTDSSARLDSLAGMWSPPLRDIMPLFEKPSQNQIGEILFKSLALTKTGVGTADSAQQVVSRQLIAWGAQPDGFVVRDGSGLSRHDYVSPRTIVTVLDAMRRSPDFRLFYDALPIAGVDGTIRSRMKGTPAEGNIHAKTGTLDKARSLSGYVTTADGRMLLFSALANNYTVPTRRVDQVTDALGAWLAGLRLDR